MRNLLSLRSFFTGITLGAVGMVLAVLISSGLSGAVQRQIVGVRVLGVNTPLDENAAEGVQLPLERRGEVVFSKDGRLWKGPLNQAFAGREIEGRPLFSEETLPRPQFFSSLTASAAGDRIAFAASPGSSIHFPSDVYVAFSDGSGLLKLTESRQTDDAGGECLKFIEAPDGTPGPVGTPYCSYFSEPRISPDGARVLYKESKTIPAAGGGEASFRTSLFVIDSQGGAAVVIAEDVEPNIPMAWSADGRSVFFMNRLHPGATLASEFELVRRDLSGGEPAPIAPGYYRSIEVGPSGDQVYVSNPEGLFAVPAAGGRPRRLSRVPLENWKVSPDGRTILGLNLGRPYLVDTRQGGLSELRPRSGLADTIGFSRTGPNFDLVRSNGRMPSGDYARAGDIQLIRGLDWIDDHTLLCSIGTLTNQTMAVLTLDD